MAEQQWEIEVRGKVQGVWFRDFTRQKANDFNIKGWVRNTSDEGVHILAVGEIIDLETFADWVRQGPPLSRVQSVSIDKFEKVTGFPGFEIKY
jgi:acylphosphatase